VLAGTINIKDNKPLTNPVGAPKIIVVNKPTIYEDELYFNKYSALDTNTPSWILDWSVNTNAGWLDIKEDGNLSGIPLNSDVGIYWVNVSVTDGGYSDSTNFTLTVININDPPIITTTNIHRSSVKPIGHP
jgi:hypothetical protein